METYSDKFKISRKARIPLSMKSELYTETETPKWKVVKITKVAHNEEMEEMSKTQDSNLEEKKRDSTLASSN